MYTPKTVINRLLGIRTLRAGHIAIVLKHVGLLDKK